MSHRFRFFIVIAAIVSSLGIFAAAAAADNGVTVFNQGNNPDSCGVAGYGGDYSGFATVIFDTDEGVKHFGCHATLVSGTAVPKTTKVKQDGCTWIFTPSGVVDVICPLGF